MDDMGTDAESIPQIEDDELDRMPPKWPKVVGIISIVLAGVSVTCTGCGVLSAVVFLPMARSQFEGQALPPSMQLGPVDYAGMGVGMGMTILLLIAGITTLARKALGRVLHLVYGGLSLPLVMWSVWMQVQKQAVMAQWVKDNPDSPFAQGQNPMWAMVGIGATVVIGLAYPVFCLIWFGVVKTRHEQMTGGVIEPAA